MSCPVQPALTRASSQVREESLPFFYGPNKIYFETATFYPDSEADTLHTRNDSKGPKGWWRGIGDTNLRLVKHLHIIDRKSPTSSPTVELEIDRTGALGVVRLFEHRSLRSSDVIDASNSTPETAECAQQLRVDGPFVRGIEMALVHRRALGIITADWPSMLSRPKGIRRVSRALGGDVGVYSPETTNDRTPKQSGVAHGSALARDTAVEDNPADDHDQAQTGVITGDANAGKHEVVSWIDEVDSASLGSNTPGGMHEES